MSAMTLSFACSPVLVEETEVAAQVLLCWLLFRHSGIKVGPHLLYGEHDMNWLGQWRQLLVRSYVHLLTVVAQLGELAGEPACPAAGPTCCQTRV